MKILRKVNEAEAIGEFLKNEFYQTEYHSDRHRYEHIVMEPDYSNAEENAVRRALLFRRRGHMWRELPVDTKWCEVELEPKDLSRVHVFPRAQWRKLANGSFVIGDVVEQIRSGEHKNAGDEVIAKIQQLRYRLKNKEIAQSAILLIGTDESHQLTVLEGNHRLTAALLVSPDTINQGFRVICGFSPNMGQSCWYRTNLPNLMRYLKNRLMNIYDREANVSQLPFSPRGYQPIVQERLGKSAVSEQLADTPNLKY